MSDPSPDFRERYKQLLEPRKPGGPLAPTPPRVEAPLPGFKFGIGDHVLDLTTGARGTVRAAYYGAAIGGRVYEVQIDGGALIPRVESELERDRPIAPAPPTVTP